MITYDDAIAKVKQMLASGEQFSTAELYQIAAQVTTDAVEGKTQGSVTLVYSGFVNGIQGEKVISELVQQGADIRVTIPKLDHFLPPMSLTRHSLNLSVLGTRNFDSMRVAALGRRHLPGLPPKR